MTAFRFQTGVPLVRKGVVGRRSLLTLFGATIAWSRYDEPRPAASGAQLAIHRSLWIYTRRHAYGFGQVEDWAMLQYIEWSIEGQPWYTSETGRVELAPPAIMRVTHGTGPAPAVKPDETFQLQVRNRNQVAAYCEFEFHGAVTGNDPNAIDYYRNRSHLSYVGNRQQLTAASFTVPPLTNTTVKVRRPTLSQFEIHQVEYSTAPIGPKRWSRIHGRPEWKD